MFNPGDPADPVTINDPLTRVNPVCIVSNIMFDAESLILNNDAEVEVKLFDKLNPVSLPCKTSCIDLPAVSNFLILKDLLLLSVRTSYCSLLLNIESNPD